MFLKESHFFVQLTESIEKIFLVSHPNISSFICEMFIYSRERYPAVNCSTLFYKTGFKAIMKDHNPEKLDIGQLLS